MTKLFFKKLSEILDSFIIFNKNIMGEQCHNCNKRLDYLKFVCKCSFIFCIKCRYPEEHECYIDYISEGREILEKENPKIHQNKLKKI